AAGDRRDRPLGRFARHDEAVDQRGDERQERDRPEELHRGPRHPSSSRAESTRVVARRRNIESRMPSPTAASPAATVIVKTVNTWPVRSPCSYEKATRFRLTAFRISSIDIRIVIMLRRLSTPNRPIEKSSRLNAR